MSKLYKACVLYKAYVDGRSVITVLASSEAEARKEIKRQLSKNPSRRAYLRRWNETGRDVRPA